PSHTREDTGSSIVDWWKSELRKLSLQRLVETAFLITFFLIWLPRAIPAQSIIAFFWPIYHWYGVDYYIPLVKAPSILIGSVLACFVARSEEHTSELQSRVDLVCRL